MDVLLAVIVGALAAVLLILFCRKNNSPFGELRFFAIALLIASLIYVLFLVNGATPHWRYIELAGVLIYGGIAWISWRWKSASLLALGWVIHVGWDVFLHNSAETSFVPFYYEELCIGCDLVIAAYLFFFLKNRLYEASS